MLKEFIYNNKEGILRESIMNHDRNQHEKHPDTKRYQNSAYVIYPCTECGSPLNISYMEI